MAGVNSLRGERRDTWMAGIRKREPDSLRGPKEKALGTLGATQPEIVVARHAREQAAKVVETAKADCARRVGPFRENRSRVLMIAERERKPEEELSGVLLWRHSGS